MFRRYLWDLEARRDCCSIPSAVYIVTQHYHTQVSLDIQYMYSVLFIAVLYYDYCTTRVPVKSTGILVIERGFYVNTRIFMELQGILWGIET